MTDSVEVHVPRADAGTRRKMAVAIAFGLLAAAFQVTVPGDTAYLGLYALIGVAIVVMTRTLRRHRNPNLRLFWFLVASISCLIGGMFTYALVEPKATAQPAWLLLPGLLWLGTYVFQFTTGILIVRRQWGHRPDKAIVLDALVVLVAVMVPVFELAVRPSFELMTGPLAVRLVNSSYVLLDGLTLVLIAQLILTGDRRNPTLWFLVGAAGMIAGGDLLVILFGATVDFRYISAGWILGNLWTVLAFLHPRLPQVVERNPQLDKRLDRTRAVILGFALTTVPITVVLAQAGGSAVDTAMLLVAAVVVALLVLVRLTWLFGDREAAQRQVEARERRFRALVQNIGDVISMVEPDGSLRYRSQAASRLLGMAEETPAGGDALAFVHPADRPVADQLFAEAVGTPRRVVAGQVRSGNDDDHRWLEVTFQNLLDDPDVTGVIVTCHDITERHMLEEELRHEAYHDPLTELPNRALALERLERMVQRASRGGTRIGVGFVDLDFFKEINDTLGHAAGDQLLRGVAQRLSLAVRPQDTVARIGGDEFLVLLETADDAGLVEVARRLVDSFSEPFVLAGRKRTVTVSVGVASSPGTQSGEELLHDADVALYRAKEAGRNGYAIFDQEMVEAS